MSRFKSQEKHRLIMRSTKAKVVETLGSAMQVVPSPGTPGSHRIHNTDYSSDKEMLHLVRTSGGAKGKILGIGSCDLGASSGPRGQSKRFKTGLAKILVQIFSYTSWTSLISRNINHFLKIQTLRYQKVHRWGMCIL